ncbi:alpha/beta hydrolase [uncultured Bifidobacterium sp.]|uniref:PGAP1-like alpha/beta domain-containing protein n=1 Tax=uncultured Bifidobacterium sp. TaxID=165187 RepID=UPI00262E3E92|nr:alpha/beta hydrolase [uncultured Bifidobacterium sp.]
MSSSVSGGSMSAARSEQFTGLIRAIHAQAGRFERLALLWMSTGMSVAGTRASFAALNAVTGNGQAWDHIIARQSALCLQYAESCASLAKRLSFLGDQVSRAHGLYSQAEETTRTVLSRMVRIAGAVNPTAPIAATLGLATIGAIRGLATDGKITTTDFLSSSAALHEATTASAADSIMGTRILTASTGLGMVSAAARSLAMLTSRINNLIQGDTLTLTSVTPSQEVALPSETISDVLENLRRLSQERLGRTDLDSGLSYATIAIQQYVNSSGERTWLVLIPGTDGQPDSPFGWEQNLEAMSASGDQRARADSVRMVVEAMRQAGIEKMDSVILAGHSQGGIVAASVAADMSNSFTIDHIITAGSPIANHPIPSSTLVTGIEMEDELVASLDGRSNPNGSNQITIRGRSIKGSTDAGTQVEGAHSGEITHWLNYHQAAYADALSWGSPQVLEHESNVSGLLSGGLVSTTYWQGRMGR